MLQLRTSTYGLISLPPFEPSQIKGPLLAGSQPFRATGDFGLLLLQLYQAAHFSISLHQYHFHEETLVSFPFSKADLLAVSCLKGHAHHHLDTTKITLLTGQYFLTAGSNIHDLLLEANLENMNFVVSYNFPLLTPLLTYFPLLASLIDQHHTSTCNNQPAWMNKHMNSLIEQIMSSYYEPALRDFLFHEHIHDLLYSMLIELGLQPAQFNNLSASDIDKIYKARALILENLKTHHPIHDLSRQVGLNDFKLKEGFRQLFGKGPFGVLKDARMQIAYELLLHTSRPEKDIMTEAGYTSLSAFVKAFRSVYGIPPGHLRSKSGNQS